MKLVKTISEDKFCIIQEINLDDVLNQDKKYFNSNNHRENGKPDDYGEVLDQSMTHLWIDAFMKNYSVLNIDKKELPWLKEAYNIGRITRRFPHLYDEELDLLLQKHQIPDNFNGFVRTETVSLKYGQHGVGPYNSLKKIIESMVTGITGHSPITEDTKELKIYLLPWKDFKPDKEFRMFVCQNKLTAISQQNIYQSNEILSSLNSKDRIKLITSWIRLLSQYWDSTIKNSITHVQNYTIDIAILEDFTPYFIEINSFGKEYAAGSALYHWLLDEDILYGKYDQVYFRYVTS